MRKFATPMRVMRALAAATLPTGMSVESKTVGLTRVINSSSTARAMRRFLHRSTLFNTKSKQSAHVSALRIFRCFDVCGNTSSYKPNGKCVSVEHSANVFSDLVNAASGLYTIFTAARQSVLDGTWPSSVPNTYAVKITLCKQLYKFDTALSEWRKDTSFELQEDTRNVLFNLCDATAVLCEGVRHATGSAIPSPFLHAKIVHFQEVSRQVEAKFLKAAVMFNGIEMLDRMKATYHNKNGSINTDVVALPLSQPLHNENYNDCNIDYNINEVETAEGLKMRDIVYSLSSHDTYTYEEVQHESVLDLAFQIKEPHLGRIDPYLQRVTKVYDEGCVFNMYFEIRAQPSYEAVPIYRHTILAVTRLRDHLQELDLHSHRDLVLRWLDIKRLKTSIKKGTLTWAYIISMLQISVYAMRYCVGSDVARVVLFKNRQHVVNSRRGLSPNSTLSCNNAERVLVSKPQAYLRLIHDTSNALRSSDRENTLDRTGDGSRFALDRDVYIHLKSRIKSISGANATHTTSELGILFCNVLVSITTELRKLDVSLANAEIQATRSCSMSMYIETEKIAMAQWFEKGLSMKNTLQWLKQHKESSMTRRIFSGYMSLIMSEASLQLDEMRYPELVVLDISYIHKARGTFYGQVALATVLVIVGQRLTEDGIPRNFINECLSLLSVHSEFIMFVFRLPTLSKRGLPR
ncbi:hypothetical protein T484DRAFT_1757013 [Baffinella frigidus]|nr:hypothetical protein T484DRAFT_1757013 [Cryptophyta sp. CCMP2293]